MVKKLEDQKMTLETALAEKSELLSNLENRADTGTEQLLAVQEEADELRTKANMTEELQAMNYDLKKAAEKAEAELLVANAELKEAQNAKNLFEEELKHATDLSSSLGQEKQSLQEEVAVLQARTKELQESLINAGKALDDSIQEKDELERNFHAQLREGEMKLEKERQQFENEMSNTRQQTELLQQSSEAALFKLQGERQQISSVRDQLVEQKGLVEKYKNEIQSWKSKFEDQFGDKTSLEKKIVELNQKIQTLEEDIDQIGIDRDMWKNKSKELNQVHADKLALQQELSGMMNRLRDASGLAEQKESEVEKLKLKYGELRQALDMAEKERQFDLKEREALVYRAEALQREFDHTNKLLQNEKSSKVSVEDELARLRKSAQNDLDKAQETNALKVKELQLEIENLQQLKPEQLKESLERAERELEFTRNSSEEIVEKLRLEIASFKSSNSTQIDSLTSQLEDISAQLSAATAQKSELESELAEKSTEFRSKLERYQEAMVELERSLREREASNSSNSTELSETKTKLERSEKELSEARAQLDELRSSILESRRASASELDKIQTELVNENKNYRAQLAAAQSELTSAQSEIERLDANLSRVREQLDRQSTESASREDAQMASSSQLKDQMTKMQERLNMVELEKNSAASELTSIRSNHDELERELNKLNSSNRTLTLEREQLSSELAESKREREKLEEKYNELMIKKEEPEVDTSKIVDEDGDPALVKAMKNELAVLREKNRILEQKYKINRRISPRVQIKAGKTIEPPEMAPESTYTSSFVQDSETNPPSSSAQLSVLRHELRQREELISRLVDDISNMKSTLKNKDDEMSRKFKKFAERAEEYSANLVMVAQLQKSERKLKKDLKKAEKRAQGTYDGDDELKEMLKQKIDEISALKSSHQKELKKLKSRRKSRRSRRSKEPSENPNSTLSSEINENANLLPSPKIDAKEIPAEENPDDYVTCAIM